MSTRTNPSAGIDTASNFVFSQLFKNFKCDEVDLFVFDNFEMSLETDTTTASFSGDLKMTGKLAVFQKFLASEAAIRLTGKIETSGTLGNKISPQSLTLTSLLPFHIPLFEGVTLIQVYFQLAIKKSGAKWIIVPTLGGFLDVDNITDADETKISLEVTLEDRSLKIIAAGKNITGGFGLHELMLDTIRIEGIVGTKKQLTITSEFEVGDTVFNFAGTIAPNTVGIIASAENFTMTNLAEIFKEIAPGKLIIPDFDVQFNHTSIAFATADCKVGSVSLIKGLTLSTDLTAHEHTISALAEITPAGVSFSGSIGNLEVGPVAVQKAGLDFQIYKNSTNKSTLFKIYGQAKIQNVEVDTGLYFEKQTSSWVTVLYASIAADEMSMSTFFPEVKGSMADQLSLSKVGFVFASADCIPQRSASAIQVRKGLQLLATVKEVPGLSDLTGEENLDLQLAAHIGETMDISIAMPNTQLDLGASVETDPFKIVINLLPKPSIALVFGMNVTIPNQLKPLHFDMMLDLSLLAATGSVTMKNYWRNPFGVNGLKIGPAVALQLGINYAQFVASGTPSKFGIAGGLVIGDTVMDMAVNISENPLEEILSGTLKKLDMKQIVTFASEITNLNIPEEDIPDFLDINNLQLYLAPAGGSIGTITYEKGVSFACDMVIMGKQFAFYARIADNGIEGGGHIDQLELGPLKISGQSGEDATMNLDLTTTEQAFSIDGAISFLGSKKGVYVSMSNKGIEFQFEENFFNLLKYEMRGKSSGEITKPSSLDFQLAADMQNDITSFLKNDVSSKINTALSDAKQGINAAQKKVDQTQKTYQAQFDKAQRKVLNAQKDADAYLKKLQADMTSAKKKYASEVGKAQKDLDSAQAAYNSAFAKASGAVQKAEKEFNSGIATAQAKVNKAQRDYNAGISSAQKALASADRTYRNSIGSAQSQVKSASRKVDGLLKSMKSTKRKIKSLSWYEKPAIAYYGSKLAGLYTAYGTAKGVLAAANEFLNGVKYGGSYVAFKSAQTALNVAKTGAKYTAFAAAKGGLQAAKTGAKYSAFEGAKKTLDAVRYGSEYTAWTAAEKVLASAKVVGKAAIDTANQALANVGSSAVYVALNAANIGLEAVEQGSSAVAFGSAKAALEAAKAGSKAVLGLADFIATHSGDLFDLRSMHLSGSLKKIERGSLFKADLEVSVLGKDYDWKLNLNARDVASFIEMLFTKAFDEAKSIAGF